MNKLKVGILLVTVALRIYGNPQEHPSWTESSRHITPVISSSQTSNYAPLVEGTFSALLAGTDLAALITPEIEELARGLQNDPVRIYQFVRERIKHSLYFGSKK